MRMHLRLPWAYGEVPTGTPLHTLKFQSRLNLTAMSQGPHAEGYVTTLL